MSLSVALVVGGFIALFLLDIVQAMFERWSSPWILLSISKGAVLLCVAGYVVALL